SAATDFGHDYLALTDHASGPGTVADIGLSDDDLAVHRDAIHEVDESAAIDVLAGVEANINAEGGISVEDSVLETLDVVVASPHSALSGDGTDRIIEAIEHPEVDIIGHPTGRYLNQRAGLELDFGAVAEAAAENDVALEINANPRRLDLSGGAVRTAIGAGAVVVIDTDAHQPASYDLRTYGVHTARRGWAEPDDVLNTMTSDDLRDFLDR